MKSSRALDRRDTEFAELYRTFNAVIDAYRQITKEVPLLSTVPMDDEVRRGRTITSTAIEFIVDVQNATTSVLKKEDEQSAFFALLNEEKVRPGLVARVASKCGRIYETRNLHPALYFKRSMRRGSIQSQRRAA